MNIACIPKQCTIHDLVLHVNCCHPLFPTQVTAAVVSITSKWALDKCLRWMDMKLRGACCFSEKLSYV